MTLSGQPTPSLRSAPTIPVIDFGPYLAAAPGALAATAGELRRALEHVGFFVMVIYLPSERACQAARRDIVQCAGNRILMPIR